MPEVHRDDVKSCLLSTPDQGRDFLLVDEIGSEEFGGYQKHADAGGLHGRADLVAPVLTGADLLVIPLNEVALLDQPLWLADEAVLLLSIMVAVPDEDAELLGHCSNPAHRHHA